MSEADRGNRKSSLRFCSRRKFFAETGSADNKI